MIKKQFKYLFRRTTLQAYFTTNKKISFLKNMDAKHQQIETEFPPTIIIA